MNKHIFTFLLPVLLVLLAGCRSEEAAQPTPTHYWTALEAYEQIRPAMLAWHEDAVVVSIDAASDERPEWQIRSDGTAPAWSFMVSSPSIRKTTEIVLRGDKITVGVDGLPEVSMTTDRGLPLDETIDSDEAVEIALRNGVSTDDILEDICTSNYNGATGRTIPMSWELAYLSPHTGAVWRYIFINVVTGEVIRNDFAE